VYGQESAPEQPKGFRSMTTLKIAYVFGRLKLVDEDPAIPADLTFYKNRVYREVGKKINDYSQYYMNRFFNNYLKDK